MTMRIPGLLPGKVRVLPVLVLCLIAIAVCVVVVSMSGNALAAPLVKVDPQYSMPVMPLRISTKTPAPLSFSQPKVFRLTSGGCCPYPSWSRDSSWVPFLDRPGPDEPAGLYAIPTNGGEVSLIVERVGVYSKDWSRVAYQDGNRTIVERWADIRRWEIPNEGRQVLFSPSGQWVEWEVISRGIKFPDLRQRAIWLATYDGKQAREVVTVNGGEFVGWARDEDAIIVTGRLAPYGPSGIWRISIEDGAGLLLLEIENPRRALLSQESGWVAFTITFNTDNELNGLWVMRTDGSMLKKLDMFGAYRWRREGVLLVIPLDLESPGPSLWQVNTSNGESLQLTDPAYTSLPIANNDWVPSPDGTRIVFLSSFDRNLWILELPEP
jgi:hypothetical protein